MKKVCVIGSINMDMVVENKNFVKSGETVTGLDFFTTFGGKGANQAVAGDTFNGAFAFALSNGYDLRAAIELSNKAAGFSVTKKGAQTGMSMVEDIGI